MHCKKTQLEPGWNLLPLLKYMLLWYCWHFFFKSLIYVDLYGYMYIRMYIFIIYYFFMGHETLLSFPMKVQEMHSAATERRGVNNSNLEQFKMLVWN